MFVHPTEYGGDIGLKGFLISQKLFLSTSEYMQIRIFVHYDESLDLLSLVVIVAQHIKRKLQQFPQVDSPLDG